MMTDPIADMLTRIRNANMIRADKVDIPASKLKIEMTKILKEKGFIKGYKVLKDKKQGILRVYLKYGEDQTNAIFGLERVSKPSRRVYAKGKDIKPVLNGMGIAILTTSKGIMSGEASRKANLGGEHLCSIW